MKTTPYVWTIFEWDKNLKQTFKRNPKQYNIIQIQKEIMFCILMIN